MEFELFSRYIPKINGVKFDGDFGGTIKLQSVFSSYPLESGYVINNNLIQRQTVVSLRLGMSNTELTSILSNPLEDITENWDSYLTGFLSNFVKSGISNYVLGLISSSLLSSSSRAGEALQSLQELMLGGDEFDLIVYNMGVLKNMVVTDIRAETNDSNADMITFNIDLRQVQKTDLDRRIGSADEIKERGELPGESEEWFDYPD